MNAKSERALPDRVEAADPRAVKLAELIGEGMDAWDADDGNVDLTTAEYVALYVLEHGSARAAAAARAAVVHAAAGLGLAPETCHVLADAALAADACEAERNPNPTDAVSWDRPLAERRTMFIYEAARLQAWAVDAPIVPEPWDERDEAFRTQMTQYVDGLCRADVLPTPEDAHDSWWQKYIDMGWRYGPERDPIAKTHPDMVPFAELEQREQDKDAVFLALVELARDWVRPVSSEDVHREAAE